MLRKLIRILFNRNTMFILMLLIQVAFLVLTILFLSQNYVWVYAGLLALNAVLAVYISNTSENPSYKMPWFLLMLIFPLYTGLAYLLIKTDVGHRVFKKNYARRVIETKKYLPQKKQILHQMEEKSSVNAHLAEYLANYGGYPVYRNYDSEYFPLGEQMFAKMKEEIRKAKRYIFLEFFIIDKGVMWEEML
ncbi:MAG: PLDc N-terminal domain-containing protein, partial [Oscillospiraceae bacterium]|nr:PLDc N-terminal domain-containing protein [Oscillospiraceae bacterium]